MVSRAGFLPYPTRPIFFLRGNSGSALDGQESLARDEQALAPSRGRVLATCVSVAVVIPGAAFVASVATTAVAGAVSNVSIVPNFVADLEWRAYGKPITESMQNRCSQRRLGSRATRRRDFVMRTVVLCSHLDTSSFSTIINGIIEARRDSLRGERLRSSRDIIELTMFTAQNSSRACPVEGFPALDAALIPRTHAFPQGSGGGNTRQRLRAARCGRRRRLPGCYW